MKTPRHLDTSTPRQYDFFKWHGKILLMLFLFNFAKTPFVYSQCGTLSVECSIEYPNALCVGTTVGIDEFSDLINPSTSNQVYFVTGSFALNKSVSFTACTFVLDDDAQLIIGPAQNIQSVGYILFDVCQIKACTKLWRNVLIKASWNMIFSSSKMSGSYEGIKLINGGNYLGRNNIFEDNYCSFTIDQNTGVSKSTVAIYTSEFRSSGANLLPGVQSTSTRPHRAIYIRYDVPGFFVNNSYFHDLQNGILLNNANMLGGISPNNVFKDIQPVDYPFDYAYLGNAISHIGSTKNVLLKMYGKYNASNGQSGSYSVGPVNTPFTPNTIPLTFNQNFINCHRAIRIQDAKGDIQNNDMISCNYGVVITLTGSGKQSEIKNNKIQDVKYVGIDFIGNKSGFASNVQSNKILFWPSGYTRIGIRHLGVGPVPAQPVKIQYNTITIGTGNTNIYTIPVYGIDISGVAGTIVEQNNIKMDHINFNYIGIYLHRRSDNCIIENNWIEANDQSLPNIYVAQRVGILADESEQNEIICNRFTKLGRCLNFLWECYETKVKSNIFVSGVQGLVYGDGFVEAVTGEQENMGNRWKNAFSKEQAIYYNYASGLWFGQSNYIVHSNDFPVDIEYWPNTIVPNAPGFKWFEDKPSLPAPPGGCMTGLVPPGDDPLPELINDLITDNTSQWPDDAYFRRNMRWHTYNYLEGHPGLLIANTTAQDFLADEALTATRKLWNIRKMMAQASFIPESTQNVIDSLDNEKVGKAEQIINLLESRDTLSLTQDFLDSLEILIDQYEMVISAGNVISEQIDSVQQNSYSQIANLLNALSVIDIMDVNQKYTMGIELKRYINAEYRPDTTERNMLVYLASLCHRMEGPGVLEARNLLTVFGIEGVMQDSTNCYTPIEPRERRSNQQASSSSGFTIYPNPGIASVSITLQNETDMENTVELRNSVGELIMLQRTSAPKISLDVSGVPAGIFNISVYSERGQVQTKRWIKIK